MQMTRKPGGSPVLFITGILILVWLTLAGVAAAGQLQDLRVGQVPSGQKALMQKAGKEGMVHVIVGIRTNIAPEGRLSPSGIIDQRSRIARAQTRILNRLQNEDGRRWEPAVSFRTIPYLVLTVDTAQLQALLTDPEVVSVQEDRLNKAALTRSTPLIGMSSVWQDGYSGQGQTIAILDTGVDKFHPFLAGKVVSEACFSTNRPGSGVFSLCPEGLRESTRPGSARPCTINGCDHGTHVAGIAAGLGATFAGVAREARIIAIQVFSRLDRREDCGDDPAPCTAAWDSDIIRALEHVSDLRHRYNIAAVNLSLGGGEYSTACDHQFPAYMDIIGRLRDAGIVTFAASGNESNSNGLTNPACLSPVISVGATDRVDQVARYSNSAEILDLLAPGSAIYSAVPDGNYATISGTSMSTPHAAGAWAALKSARPDVSTTLLLNILKNSGVPKFIPTSGLIRPRIQVDAALAQVTRNRPNLPRPPPSQLNFFYHPVAWPITGSRPEAIKPIGWGPAAAGGDMIEIHVSINPFSVPVDLYFLVYSPEIDSEVYSWSGSVLEPLGNLSAKPWKSGIREFVNTQVFETFPADLLGTATWYLGLMATPAGATNMHSAYLWYTVLPDF